MKVLIYIDSFDFDLVGGARRVFWEECRELLKQGHQVDVICRHNSTDELSSQMEGVCFHGYPNITGSIWGRLGYYKKQIVGLTKDYLSSKSPDYVVFHSASSVLGVSGTGVFAEGVTKTYIFHSPWNLEYDVLSGWRDMLPLNPRWLFHRMLSQKRWYEDQRALDWADHVVTLSKYMHSVMLEEHPSARKASYTVSSGGADLERFRPAADANEKEANRVSLGLAKDAWVIVTTRRLVPRTGVDLLIKAFAQARNGLPKQSLLLLVGKGPERDKLEQLTDELGLRRSVRFVGYVSDDELPSYYRASDLFVMPTKQLEGFGLSTVEALACGVPVVATDVGGSVEILRGICPEALTSSVTPEALAAKLVEFSKGDNPSPGKEELRTYVEENFTWQKHTSLLLESLTRGGPASE